MKREGWRMEGRESEVGEGGRVKEERERRRRSDGE